eukprot:11349457-Alexandrium_andersonii.AAC.1
MLSTTTRCPRSTYPCACSSMSPSQVRTRTFSSGWGRPSSTRLSQSTALVSCGGSVSSGAPEARSRMTTAAV